jgi:hypothetical protein
MARYAIPKDVGRLRVAMGPGGHYVVWNGKQGRGEFTITCRTRKQAEELIKEIRANIDKGFIEVQ